MNKPIIELKKIEVHVGLSEETPAYTATVYVDGKPFAEASNSGHGGPDMYHFKDVPQNKGWDLVKELNERIEATYPTTEYQGLILKESLEALCHVLVWEHVDQRNFRSSMSRKVMFVKKGQKGVFTLNVKPKDPRVPAYMATKYPGAIVLNYLTFDEAWKMYRENAA